ncbi:MAG: flavodoxin [Coriobacteriia bacterium]|nr:flavodoxin [Coriobacteriia bacterium]
MPEMLTRREFVTATAVLSAGIAVASAAGCTRDAAEAYGETPTPSVSYEGSNAMSKRVLVGYATRSGSTTGVAEAIGKTLAAQGHAADVKPMKGGPSVRGYDAVILGSAINGGQWLPEAVEYLETNQKALAAVPVSLFCVHAMNCGSGAEETKKRLAYLGKERALVTPAAEGFFAGQGPSVDSNAIVRWAFRAFGGDVEGDGRDWHAIEAWAKTVPV